MKLFFKKYGEGKPLIILHGLFGMSDNWMTLSKKFSDHGFAVYTVDLRNHGRSPHDDEFSYRVMVDDLFTLMADENIAAADFIGHSMGGKAAMFFAVTYPDKTNRLVVSDIAPRFYSRHHDGVFAALHSVSLDSSASRKAAEEQIRLSLQDESTVQFLLKNLYWKEESRGDGTDPEKKLAWRFNLSSIEKNIDAVGEALEEGASFDKPTLFVRGERSGYITAADEKEIQKHFPGAEVRTIAGAGHWIHAEKPEEFFEVVMEFLKN
jgi:esterase